MSHRSPDRRNVISLLSAAGLAALTRPEATFAQGAELPPTPSCEAHATTTPRQTEGPFFTPSSPQRADLRDDGGGTLLVLSGFVLTRQCRPVPGALLDFWHADTSGQYDNRGFRFRGHLFADQQGRYQFITRAPGLYTGRTRHLHVKVRAGGQSPVLTTQLYFPDEPGNRRDGLFDQKLLMTLRPAEGGQLGRFDFVLAG
ncbi:MAG TPA: intradiol ring-cleavage dioxygenase [Bosea sp. (in: a-proteobacteria)]|nr:intradiol ring-cleavage dioxygenase [Bosea sp. (in: a-proteobacteria)]